MILIDGTFVVHATGSWKSHPVATASQPGGPWHEQRRQLLTTTPSWMSTTGKVWAPSVVRSRTGTYVVYYAALVKVKGSARCIGTGTSIDPAGPFTPQAKALACWKGSGASP